MLVSWLDFAGSCYVLQAQVRLVPRRAPSADPSHATDRQFKQVSVR